jgi:uncharacterized DUF497 family protein
MEISFSSDKNETNIKKHGIALKAAEDFDWTSAIYAVDNRKDYGESRFIAVGLIGTRLHVMIFTPRDGGARVISLRKANRRERRNHEQGV